MFFSDDANIRGIISPVADVSWLCSVCNLDSKESGPKKRGRPRKSIMKSTSICCSLCSQW